MAPAKINPSINLSRIEWRERSSYSGARGRKARTAAVTAAPGLIMYNLIQSSRFIDSFLLSRKEKKILQFFASPIFLPLFKIETIVLTGREILNCEQCDRGRGERGLDTMVRAVDVNYVSPPSRPFASIIFLNVWPLPWWTRTRIL